MVLLGLVMMRSSGGCNGTVESVLAMVSHCHQAGDCAAELVLAVVHQGVTADRQGSLIDRLGALIDCLGAADARYGATTDCQGALVDYKGAITGHPSATSNLKGSVAGHHGAASAHQGATADLPGAAIDHRDAVVVRGVDCGGHRSQRNVSSCLPYGGHQLSWFMTMI
jgi:hypothetical protein